MGIINPRIGIPQNLPTGATHDLLLIDFPDGFPEGKLKFDLNNVPRKITGIEKVAQFFLKILFTTTGSDVLNPALGTMFSPYAVSANRTGVDNELYTMLTREISTAVGQCRALLNDTTADNASKLDSVSVIGLDTGPDSILMYLRLKTMAGELAQVSVPFPQLDMVLSES